jgi:predicted phage terminase large subunit-like protein
MCERLLERQGQNWAVAAPRGSAKSTLTALILPIHDILYQLERYIVIISATLKQAKQRLKNLKAELLTNTLLHEVYGKVPYKKKDWSVKSINVNGVQIDVFSAGTELRGITHHEFRPTKVILDDCEDSDAVESADQREKILNWFQEVIENLGDRYTHIDIIGTILHPESLLATLLKRPDFCGSIYRSITQFSDNAELWNQWKALYTNLADPNRTTTARLFFNAHRQEMLKGTSVLWQSKEDYYELMCQMTTRGRRAFFKEKQNQPYHPESRIFDPAHFHYFHIEGDTIVRECHGGMNSMDATPLLKERISLGDLTIFGFLDSALGGSRGTRRQSGDYAAIATVGRDPHGYLYLLDLWMKRVPPTKQIEQLFELHQRWQYQLVGVETNCFQKLLLLPLEQERERRKQAGERWDLAVRDVEHKQNKVERIVGIEPAVVNGWILFNRGLLPLFFQQCEEFPCGTHDDALDALEGAVSLSASRPINHQAMGTRKSFKALQHF